MSKIVSTTAFALALLTAGIASAAPSHGSASFDAHKFFAERQLSGN